MRTITHACTALAAGALIAAGPTPSLAQKKAEFEMRVGFVTYRDQQHDYADMLKEEIEKATNGRIEVKIYPRGELGPIPQQIEGTQLGTQAAYIAPTDFFAGVDSRFGIFSVPTLFSSKLNGARTLTDPELMKELRGLAAGKGLQTVAVFMHSAAHYMARTPLATIGDFKGLKMRINATEAERQKMAVFGATGIPMPLGAVLPALQRGEIDGTMSAIAIYANMGFSDFSKSLLKTEDQFLISAAVLSTPWLAKLPKDLRETVVQVAEGLMPRITKASLAADAPMEAKWESQGGKIVTLSPPEQEKFLAALSGVGDKVTANNPAAAKLLARVRALSKKY